MSQQIIFEPFESVSLEDEQFAEVHEEVLFSEEMQDLQSSLNKKRLLELQRKLSRIQSNQFNIHIGEFTFTRENEETKTQNEIVFVYAKGLMCDWEFPLFTFYVLHAYYEGNFSLDKLLKMVLQLLNAVDLQPFACIIDWTPSSQKILCDMGVTVYNPYIGEDHRRTLLCTDSFKTIKKFDLDQSIPENVMAYIKFFDQECENLEDWKTEFTNFKELLKNSCDRFVQIFSLYYTVSSRMIALELAKMVNTWPLKMVSFRQTKLDLFLYRIRLEKFSSYDEMLRALPNIYQEYY